MGELLAQTVPLALGAAISPVLLLLQLTTMTGQRPLARGSALALGAAIPLVVLGGLAVLVGESSSLHTSSSIKGAIYLVLGTLLFFGIGLRALWRPSKPQAQTAPTSNPGVGRAFALGLAGMASNLTTFALFIPAMKLIADADVTLAARAVTAAIVLLITLAMALVPLVLTALAPTTSTQALSAIGRWLHKHQRGSQVALGFGFGNFLMAKGILAL